MPAKFKKLIQDYGDERAIEVPPGYARGSASQYAIIRLLPTPKLVARTWFAMADMLNYIALDQSIKENGKTMGTSGAERTAFPP